jgi:NitT/TauT family transport system substrate-binding protein
MLGASRFAPRRRFLKVLAALAVFGLIAAACGDDDGGGTTAPAATTPAAPTSAGAETKVDPLAPHPLAKRTELKVVTNIMSTFMAPVLLAAELGEFEKENISVGNVDLVPATDGLALLAQGRIDIQYSGPDARSFNAVAQGINVKWTIGNFAENDAAPAGLYARRAIFSNPANPNPAELKGKSIGTPSGPGGIAAYSINELLKTKGLDYGSMNAKMLSAGDINVALKNNALDAGWLLSNSWIDASKDPNLVFLGGPHPYQPLGGAFFGPNILEKNREAGLAFLRAIARVVRDHLGGEWSKKPDIVAKIAKGTGQPESAVLTGPPMKFTLKPNPTIIAGAQDFFRGLNLLEYKETLPTERFVDMSFSDEVLGK